MKAIAFANRLSRDLAQQGLADLTADARLEILDAINGGLQMLHAIAPAHTKLTVGSIPLEAPVTVSIGVTAGSVNITGTDFTTDQFYRTIRVGGDTIDNQIVGTNQLLHPYSGEGGTVTAVIYCDGVAIPQPYAEMVGDPIILETRRHLTSCNESPVRHSTSFFRSELSYSIRQKQIAEPYHYWVEANAMNTNPPAPAVFRVNTLPNKAYRLQAGFMLAPARILFTDLLAEDASIPLREEQVELYLLPISRALLSSSSLWKDKTTRKDVQNASEKAQKEYATLASQTLATPRNRVGVRKGY